MARRSRRRGLAAGGGLLVRALPGVSPAFLVVALLACVLVPLPTPLVDLLLSVSLAGAVLLLVAALGVRRTTEFLGFPSLLLLATLFRLALNVSTTRLILSQADAGQVIDAFAGFVVRDDLIVGGVMFAIITIVQYLVIARGAERVAEVGARFALDGLPGHQAAIDADLRAGVISAREASRRRARLAERSGFHGAMDGAVKFVKGDAVAGLAITAVNLVGGLAIGMGRMGYGWEQSLDVYGRLTVGDGLLAQIPALLVSLAAGVLVSRVDREEDGDVRSPIAWLDPAMLLVPAGMLLVLALVPRMPGLAFITTAVALLTVALFLAGRRAEDLASRPAPRAAGIRVSVPTGVLDDLRRAAESLDEVRRQCSLALGVEVPPVDLRVDPELTGRDLRIELGGRVLAREPLGAEPGALVVQSYRALVSNGEAFVDLELLDRRIAEARGHKPAVVHAALSALTPPDLLAVVQAMLRERVPVPPMDAVLTAVSEEPLTREASERERVPDLVRMRLAPYWIHDVLDAARRLGPPAIVRCDLELEDEVVARPPTGARRQELVDRARALAQPAAEGEPPRPLVLVATTPGGRRAMARVFAGVHPHVPVLGAAELDAAGVALPATAWLS